MASEPDGVPATELERLRAAVQELEAKLAKQEKKAAKWKKAAKAERTRAAKLDAALRRATAPPPVDGVDTGDLPVEPPSYERRLAAD